MIAIIASAIVAIQGPAAPKPTPIKGNSHTTAINKKSHALIFSIFLYLLSLPFIRYFIEGNGVYIGFCEVIEGYFVLKEDFIDGDRAKHTGRVRRFAPHIY